MQSLRNILAAHAPLLLIDTASARIQTGWFSAAGEVRWQTADDDAGIGLFRCVEALDIDLGSARAFAFCEGPGSVLGIRTAAIALRIWQAMAPRPIFAYLSLALVAHGLGHPETNVIADARRDLWHHFNLASSRLRRLPAAELQGKLVMPDGFRHWSPLPDNVSRVPYAIDQWLPEAADAAIFRQTEAPDAFLHEEPTYLDWHPKIHRLPTRP